MCARVDPDKSARVTRMVLAGSVQTQAEFIRKLNEEAPPGLRVDRYYFSAWLTRRINLIDEQIELILKSIGMAKLLPKLSAPCEPIEVPLTMSKAEQTEN